MKYKVDETRFLILLSVCIIAITVSMAASKHTSWLEAASFITGAACVWLTVKESIWNFPIGLLNVTTFAFVFFKARLFADASLQVVYFVMGICGWYLWLHGGEQRSRLVVSRASKFELFVLAGLSMLSTVCLWEILERWGGSASFWDALTTSISLVAQWLLNHKKLESWVAWILVDVIYVPLYVYKELYLTALLYAVFLAMAIIGFHAWQQNWRHQQALEQTG